jgi:predicted SPOUT superfamily RNA methylase MTH1
VLERILNPKKTSTKRLILKLTLYSGAVTPFYLRKKKKKTKDKYD